MLEAIGSLVLAATLMLGSPGPATIALAATGAVFGIRGGLPFLWGILSGIAVVIVLGAAGVVALFNAYPSSRTAVGLIGAAYICYVAYKIATAPLLPTDRDANALAPSFRDGFILNLLNVKAYAAFLALFSQFALPFSSTFVSTVATAFIAYIVVVIVDATWLVIGRFLTPVFESPTLARPTRILFGLLVVLSLVLTLLP